MASDRTPSRYRKLYAALLRFYPKPYRTRYAEGMEQTFSDLSREHAEAGERLLPFALWAFTDTFIGILRENVSSLFSILTMHAKNILRPALGSALLLLIPLIAMQYTREVNWTGSDFAFMGILLFGTGLAYELIIARSRNTLYRWAVAIGILTAFLLVWVNAAVGIIGDGPVNLLYFAVIAVGGLGAIISRFQPRGLAITLFAAALTQLLVPVIALILWAPPAIDWSPGVLPVFMLNACFAAMFAGAGWLFWHAARA